MQKLRAVLGALLSGGAGAIPTLPVSVGGGLFGAGEKAW